MRKLFIILIAVITGSCTGTVKRPYEDIILAKIKANAMGVDTDTKIDSIIVIGKYTNADIINYWVSKELKGVGNVDSLISMIANVDEIDNKHEQKKWWKWQQQRFIHLKGLDPDAIAYEVAKAKYNIFNPIFNTRVGVLNYYIISDNVINTEISESDMLSIMKEAPEAPMIYVYEYMTFMKSKPKMP